MTSILTVFKDALNKTGAAIFCVANLNTVMEIHSGSLRLRQTEREEDFWYYVLRRQEDNPDLWDLCREEGGSSRDTNVSKTIEEGLSLKDGLSCLKQAEQDYRDKALNSQNERIESSLPFAKALLEFHEHHGRNSIEAAERALRRQEREARQRDEQPTSHEM